ncbi:hypothetical protein SBOR_3420 [Sclerotinia borealis F-4128]|uniref:Uncharacterized protein n=1 Tax=Sclerotinia borealis (strain F-4128) TaxID=1432307 RepID=W9CNG8_SCLBF|nr:hypothetical protein SBOR_3420 [Sclerotinia borealis F-4128]
MVSSIPFDKSYILGTTGIRSSLDQADGNQQEVDKSTNLKVLLSGDFHPPRLQGSSVGKLQLIWNVRDRIRTQASGSSYNENVKRWITPELS